MAARRFPRTIEIGLAAALLAGAGALSAQIEGGDRGAAPVDSSSDFEVGNVAVDVSGKTADGARLAGWRLAQRRGWSMLAERLTGAKASLPDSTLDQIVTGIVVEREEIGTNRYIARLGVLFDRDRAGQILGVATQVTRSPPMLVIPVLFSGGTGQVFERATPWQQAWARYRTGGSTIDYVRPVGTGADPLLLNVGQTGRRARGWWRTILDQYGASDVVMPEAHLYRSYPGGPVIGVFTAFYGPDRRALERVTLRVENDEAIPALLDRGVARLDAAYQRALAYGQLRTDALLAPPPAPEVMPAATPTPVDGELPLDQPPGVTASAITIQYETPSAGAVTATESAMRALPGVQGATTTSLALGGTSLMRVTYGGSVAALRAALEARGWQVDEGGGTLRIRRDAALEATLNPGG